MMMITEKFVSIGQKHTNNNNSNNNNNNNTNQDLHMFILMKTPKAIYQCMYKKSKEHYHCAHPISSCNVIMYSFSFYLSLSYKVYKRETK